jgi:hypothetical protein
MQRMEVVRRALMTLIKDVPIRVRVVWVCSNRICDILANIGPPFRSRCALNERSICSSVIE